MEMGLEEKFPAGMRVLAVDDDSTCLLILATMLRKCQYNVTTAKDAIKALQILRENKNEFDLVISDIDMPDMNGFELLQQLGLQMDIPVLPYDDKERVMKGINHGACHYLLKPVQIEELKHIWQHVVRRKLDSRQLQVLKGTQNVDHKPNRKRKYENKEYDKKQNEEYPTTQKKPRVVWLPELHLKFLAAVNQLGLDKAVPKRILELMNVENITRENVASHLQKYRMYLKKRNIVPTPEANMFAAFGSGHSANYSQLVTTQATEYTSYPVAASARDHEPHTHTSIQSVSQIEDVAHGMSIALGFDNGELNKDSTPIATDFSSLNFADASNFHNDFSIAINCDFAGNDLMLDGHFLSAPQQESSEHLSADSSTLDFLTDIIQFQSFYTEHGRISPLINLRDNMAAAAAAHLVINPYELSSLDSVVNTLPDTRTHLWHQEHPINHIVGHNMSRNSNILPGEFPMSSVSKNDLDGPLLGQLDNAKLTDLEAGEANNEIPTPSKI